MEGVNMARKFLMMILILIFSCSACAGAVVEEDAELHKIVGGLYSLASAVELNNRPKADINALVRFFERIPAGWQDAVKVETDKGSIWVGIAVGQYSSARRYLRSNAEALKIMESPNGAAWLGGDYAWLKAADVAKKKIRPVKFSAAQGDGTIFFNAPDTETWWAAWPDLTARAEKDILEAHGADAGTELHAPKADGEAKISIYDEVRPSSVRVPDKMYMGTRKNSFDMSVEVGDVIFNPIPNVHR